MKNVPIFPLGIVLFPRAIYPLHIFEDRYKILIGSSINSKQEFGVNLLTNSKINEVGCTARVIDVINKFDDGKLDIIIEGFQRYQLINFIKNESGYFDGNIEYIEDEFEVLDYELFIESANIFNDIVEKIQGFKIEKIRLTEISTKTPSFYLAQKSGLVAEEKQSLLMMNSENERLTYMLKHLKSLKPNLKKNNDFMKLIKNDGYLTKF